MPIKPEHLDELLAGYEKPEELLSQAGLFRQLKKALLERALGAELTHHLGYECGARTGRSRDNHRNGSYAKTVLTEDGTVELELPRDRNSSFEPQIVPKGDRRLDGFDDKMIALSARGMTVREIQSHLRELCGVCVSPDLISRVTDAVLEELRDWQNRPLDAATPCCSSMPCRFASATRAWSATRPSISPSRSIATATSTSSACGSSRPKAPNSGCT